MSVARRCKLGHRYKKISYVVYNYWWTRISFKVLTLKRKRWMWLHLLFIIYYFYYIT